MTRAGAALGVAAAVAFTAGCDPIMAVHGVVRAAPVGCEVRGAISAGAPLAGAEVRLRCPGYEKRVTTSNEAGRIDHTNVGFWTPECHLVVQKPGYRPMVFAIDELCVARTFSDCHFLAIAADLEPDR